MLRPATPLTILLFASFVLLLVSTISTPIVKGIPIARNGDATYGVFGWCCADTNQCSGIEVGWSTDNIPCLPTTGNNGFSLSGNTRNSLSSLLIVHPVAAFCNLVALGLAAAAHLHSPSHSARYLLGLLILLLPTLLITLLAFLVDILLFVPHLQWGGWIVLASTILVAASGIVTCAMRRTLVSRKARKKRIAENAEMSGANFYARQAEESRILPQSSHESKTPMMNGGGMVNGAPGADQLPSFATYDTRRSEERPTLPPITTQPMPATTPIDDGRFYGGQRSRSNSRPRSASRPRPEDFSAPLGADRHFEEVPPLPTPNRGGYGAPRGRGGYPPRGGMPRGNSRGPPPSPYGPGRGGYPNRGRGGPPSGPLPPGVMIPAGMNRRPPPGYGPQSPTEMERPYMPPPSQGPVYDRPGEPNFEPSSPSNYGSDANAPYGAAYGARAQSPSARRQSPYGSRAQSPVGSPPPQSIPPPMPPMPNRSQYGPTSYPNPGPIMDSGMQGMADMQRAHPPVRQQRSPSQDYVPPRAAWSQSPHAGPSSPSRTRRVNSGGSDYVEDVDPRFAEPPPVPIISSQTLAQPPQQPYIPGALVAGRNPNDPSPESSSSQILPHTQSYENLQPGARSPVESETSNFTSISQRPMNPNWQPGHGGEFNQFAPQPDRRHQQRKQDILFSNNPDFEIPGMGPPRGTRPGYRGGRGGGPGYGPGPGPRGGPMRPPPPSVLETMGADGRYPGPAMGSPVPGQGSGSVREI